MRKKYVLVIKFLIILNLLMIPFCFISYFRWEINYWPKFIAFLVENSLKIWNISTEREENILYIHPGTSLWIVEISWDSSGWKCLYFCSALILASPLISLKRKIKGLIVILPFLFLLNYIRIISTILVGIHHGKEVFDFFHLFLWRALNVVVVPLVWFLWFRREYRIRENHGKPGRSKKRIEFSKRKGR